MTEKPRRGKKQEIDSLSAHPQAEQPSASITRSESFAGPLPHPETLTRYNEVVPNGAERIFAMAEMQAAHRIAIESKVVQGNLSAQQRGSWFSFVITMTAINLGVWLIYLGKSTSGLVTIIAAVTSLATIFLYSKYDQRKERIEKATAVAIRQNQRK